MVKKKLVIIGGGFTGARCAKKLQNHFDVVFIDNKPYFEYTPGILRTIVEPQHLRKIQAKHSNYFKRGRLINDKVVSIAKDYVQTKKEKISFDYLIVAAGSSYNPPIKEEGLVTATRAKTLTKQFHKVHNAHSVLIIGGGLVGVELAAEIADHYSDKNITIVHSKATLIDRNHKKAIKHSQDLLCKKGVKFILNERLTSKKDNIYSTNKGTKIKADAAFICNGIQPNYQIVARRFKNLVGDRKSVRVNDFLQLEGHDNIFVGGDVTGVVEEKTAQAAERHADCIIRNVCALSKGKKLSEYKPKKLPMLISLGKFNGVMQTDKLVITGLIPAFLKVFVEWKTMIKYR